MDALASRALMAISEVAARPVEVRSLRHSGLDLLTQSSSRFDPNPTCALPLEATKGWACAKLSLLRSRSDNAKFAGGSKPICCRNSMVAGTGGR